MKKLPAFLNSPAKAVMAVGLIILLGEFSIMLLIESIHTTMKDVALEKVVFEFVDPFLLVAIASPALYFLIFRPMRDQQDKLEAAHRKIEQVHQQWTTSLDMVSDPIFLHDKQFRILRCNKAYQQCAGIPLHEIIGQPYYEIFPKTGAPLPCCLRVMEKAEAAADEEEMVVGDAIYRSRTFSVYGEQGVYLHSVHILEDITGSRRAEAVLHESEEKFRKMSESAQDAIIMMADKRISFWNAAAERIFGYTAAEALGQELHALIVPPEAYSRFTQAFPHFQASGEGPIIGKVVEVTALRKGGEEFPSELSVSATQFGGQWHAIGIVRDIAARKQTEDALKESERKYKDIVDNAVAGVYRSNLKGDLLFANQALAKIYEFESPDEMLSGGTIARYKDPEGREKLIDGLLKTGSVDNFEAEVLTKGGKTKNILFSATLDGDVISGMVTDITERKQAEAQLTEQIEELRGWNDVTLGREMRVLELKHEVDELLIQAGQPPRYPSAESDDKQEK